MRAKSVIRVREEPEETTGNHGCFLGFPWILSLDPKQSSFVVQSLLFSSMQFTAAANPTRAFDAAKTQFKARYTLGIPIGVAGSYGQTYLCTTMERGLHSW